MKRHDYIIVNDEKQADKLIAICKAYGVECQPFNAYYNQFGHRKDGGLWFSQGYTGEEISIVDFVAYLENIKKFIILSEDGVRLYSGDEVWGVKYLGGLKQWRLDLYHGECFVFSDDSGTCEEDNDFPAISTPSTYKIFSTREAAEAWIEKENKPTEIVIGENTDIPIRVFKNKATIEVNKSRLPLVQEVTISAKEIEAIYEAYKSLQ